MVTPPLPWAALFRYADVALRDMVQWDLAVLGLQLDSVALRVFSNLNYSMIQ